MTPFDLVIFDTLVPEDHDWRQLKAAIDFSPLRDLVADCSSSDQGRSAIDPVQLLKVNLLQFHDGLSDEGVIRQAQVNEARLLDRVEQLRELRAWGVGWQQRLEFGAPPVSPEVDESFCAALSTARKVLNDREPKVGDKIVWLTDPDARRSKHGEDEDGDLLDVSLDADSGLICGIDALAANAAAAANAKVLIESEQAAHDNNLESLSSDAIGYNGAVLKALSDDSEGPPVRVFVPPQPDWSAAPELYQPEDFKLNQAAETLICPNGETTGTRDRKTANFLSGLRRDGNAVNRVALIVPA